MEKTSSGLKENLASFLCYLLGWITGLIFILIEKENKTVRFHAMQSIFVFGGLSVLSIILMITVIGAILIPIVGLASFVLWIILMITSFQGKQVKIPLASGLAEKYI